MNRRRAYWRAQARANKRALRRYLVTMERHRRRLRTRRHDPDLARLIAMGSLVFLAVVVSGLVIS
jgi:hypothetical protein